MFKLSQTTDRNSYIQGLRGALAFSLFIFHVAGSGLPTYSGSTSDYIYTILLSMEFGVEIFFGISGIVILNAFKNSTSIKKFAWNRATRIFPVLWVTVLLIAILSQFDSRHNQNISATTLIANLLALPPFFNFPLIHPAAWSISFEFVFYTLFITYGLISRNISKFVGIVIISILATCLIATHLRAIGFLIGIVIATTSVGKGKNNTWWPIQYAPFTILAMLCWHYSFRIIDMPGSVLDDWSKATEIGLSVLLYVTGAVFALLGLRNLVSGNNISTLVLEKPFMQWLGKVSFSFYLWQTLTMAVVKKFMVISGLIHYTQEHSQVLFFLLSLPPTLIVSLYSHRILEENLTKWLRNRYAI